LAFLNLIPVAPLDGSKILFALLPYKWIGLRNWMERYQLFLIIAVIFVLLNVPIFAQSILNLAQLLMA
jgi:Zn-dependent protease